MLIKYTQDYWDKTPPRVHEECSGSHTMNCCGASYSRAKNPSKINRLGIRIFSGIHFKEEDNDKVQVTHVKTRNGNITVHVRKA